MTSEYNYSSIIIIVFTALMMVITTAAVVNGAQNSKVPKSASQVAL